MLFVSMKIASLCVASGGLLGDIRDFAVSQRESGQQRPCSIPCNYR